MRNMNADLYKMLGVERDASAAEVKAAYRRLAMKYHPDQNPGDTVAEERFKEVKHAYEVLSDPAKRRAYDRLRRRTGSGGGPNFDNFSELFDILNSVISAGFGGLGKAKSNARGENIRVKLSIPLEEALTGVRRDVTVPRSRECTRCGGSGAEPGTRLRTCDECDGKGQVRVQQGFFSLMRDCKKCGGRGRVVETPCRRCQGEGRVEGTELLPVDVPAGVRDGQVLRWSRKGMPARAGGVPGDLLVEVSIDTHDRFKRDGKDIHLRLPISFTQASLGAKVEVPTLDGRVLMKIPPGTHSGRVFRLKGKGLPDVGDGPRGDQYVRLVVDTPERFSAREEKGRDSRNSRSGNQSEERGFWGRVRDLFE